MGGIATLVADTLKQNTTKVGEGSNGDEYIIVRLDHIIPPGNIINWYGEFESRTPNDDILHSWWRLRKDMEAIEEL